MVIINLFFYSRLYRYLDVDLRDIWFIVNIIDDGNLDIN